MWMKAPSGNGKTAPAISLLLQNRDRNEAVTCSGFSRVFKGAGFRISEAVH